MNTTNGLMSKNEFRTVLEFIHGKAIDNLRLHKQLTPVGFLMVGNDMKMTLLDFSTDERKQESIEALKSQARKVKARGVFVVSEGWMSKQVNPENFVPPRNDPDKVSVIIIGGITPFTEGMVIQEFTIQDGRVNFGETEITIGCENASVNLLAGIFETTH